MAHWLLKTEPAEYSFEQLRREKKTRWTGISNALAKKHLRTMQAGDELLIYHTGKEKAVVGRAKVLRAAAGNDPAVEIAAGEPLKALVPLATIKADKRFAQWALVTIGRLSVVPTTPEMFQAILALGNPSQP